MKNINQIKYIGLAILAVILVSQSAEARDLVSAANSYTDTAKNIAKVVSLGGLIIGGIMFAIPGLDRFATRVFLGGVFSTCITYGAPIIISTANAIFGGL